MKYFRVMVFAAVLAALDAAFWFVHFLIYGSVPDGFGYFLWWKFQDLSRWWDGLSIFCSVVCFAATVHGYEKIMHGRFYGTNERPGDLFVGLSGFLVIGSAVFIGGYLPLTFFCLFLAGAALLYFYFEARLFIARRKAEPTEEELAEDAERLRQTAFELAAATRQANRKK